MRITVEMSLYPLKGDALEQILGFIGVVTGDPRLEIVVNQLSTQVRGELGVVMEVLTAAMQTAFRGGVPQALVVKFLNADLPILEPPVLDVTARPR
jgi:uncharacterized protein YqgV (UPF0045/DUF77 family)